MCSTISIIPTIYILNDNIIMFFNVLLLLIIIVIIMVIHSVVYVLIAGYVILINCYLMFFTTKCSVYCELKFISFFVFLIYAYVRTFFNECGFEKLTSVICEVRSPNQTPVWYSYPSTYILRIRYTHRV